MLIREYPNNLSRGNETYTTRVCGNERTDGTWEGWIEFHPVAADLPSVSTDRETSQPNLVALEYWADGLQPIYFEGALARAEGRLL